MDSNPIIPSGENFSDSPSQEPVNPPLVTLKKSSRFRTLIVFLTVFILFLGAFYFLKKSDLEVKNIFLKKELNPSKESAKLWVHYGTLQNHIGEFSEAIAAYQQACNLDPDLYEAWWNLSQVYDSLHQPQQQLNALQQAVRCRPESLKAWASLTKINLQLNQDQEAILSRQQEEIAKNGMIKEEDLEQKSYENPSNAEAWIQWGMNRAIYRFVQPNGEDPQLVKIFQKAAEYNPHNPWILAHLALSMVKKRNEIPGSPFLIEVEVPTLVPLQKSAELLPQDPTIFFLLGRLALWKGESNEAMNAFQIATHAPQAHWLSWYYLGETFLAAHRSEEAISAYTKAQSLSPDSLEIQYGIAQAYLQKGKVEEARKILEKENNSYQNPIPLTRRAYVQLQFQQTVASQAPSSPKSKTPPLLLQSFRATSIPRLEVFSPEPVILEEKRKKERSSDPLPQTRPPELPLLNESQTPRTQVIDEAKRIPQPSEEKSPLPESTPPPSLHSLSSPQRIDLDTGSFHDPLLWKAKLKNKTLDEKTLKQIIDSCDNDQYRKIAIEAAEQLVQRNPEAIHWVTLGYLHGGENQLTDEILCYQKALTLEPKNRTALFNLGLAQLQLRRLVKAQNAFEKITFNDPQDEEAWFHLALSLDRQEQWNEAATAYQKAVAINPQYTDAWLNLGGVYASIKRADLEVETYKKCLQSNPDDQPVWNNLAIALKSIGKFSDYDQIKKEIEATTRSSIPSAEIIDSKKQPSK